jgi:hypothetical protein
MKRKALHVSNTLAGDGSPAKVSAQCFRTLLKLHPSAPKGES